MERVAAVTLEVTQFGRGDDQAIERIISQDRANGMQAWSATRPHRCKKSEADAELAEQLPPCLRQIGPVLRKLLPANQTCLPFACYRYRLRALRQV
jgi:hypothetical protein